MAKKKAFNPKESAKFEISSAAHAPVEVRCRILIVCEGIKTEPNYFKSFNRIQRGGTVYEVETQSKGFNTIQVVNKAIELRDNAKAKKHPYDSVWAVFDKDSFPDKKFNDAIIKAHDNGIECAWSNEAFELWYVYHFDNRVAPMPRRDHQKTIETRLGPHIRGYKYKKNAENMRELLCEYGDESRAITWAENQAKGYMDEKYYQHNPCTMVYKLVKLLRGEDKEFNKALAASLQKP